jgi:hypothetical protein
VSAEENRVVVPRIFGLFDEGEDPKAAGGEFSWFE